MHHVSKWMHQRSALSSAARKSVQAGDPLEPDPVEDCKNSNSDNTNNSNKSNNNGNKRNTSNNRNNLHYRNNSNEGYTGVMEK